MSAPTPQHLPFSDPRSTMDRIEDLEVSHVTLTTSVDRLRRAIYLLARRDELAGREVPAGVLTLLLEPVRAPGSARRAAPLRAVPALEELEAPAEAAPPPSSSSAPSPASRPAERHDSDDAERERKQRQRLIAKAVAWGLITADEAISFRGRPGRTRGIAVTELAALLERRRLELVAEAAPELAEPGLAPAIETGHVPSAEPIETGHVTSAEAIETGHVPSDRTNVPSDRTNVPSDRPPGLPPPPLARGFTSSCSEGASEIVPLASSLAPLSSSVIVKSGVAQPPRSRARERDPARESSSAPAEPAADVTSRQTGHALGAPEAAPMCPVRPDTAAPYEPPIDPGGEIDPNAFEAFESEHLAAIAWLENDDGDELGELAEASSAPDLDEPALELGPAAASGAPAYFDVERLERLERQDAERDAKRPARKKTPRSRPIDPEDDGRSGAKAEAPSEAPSAPEEAPGDAGALDADDRAPCPTSLDPRWVRACWAAVDEMAKVFQAERPGEACYFRPNTRGKNGQTHGHRFGARKRADRALRAVAELAPGVLGPRATYVVAEAFRLHLRAHAADAGDWRAFYKTSQTYVRQALKASRRRELDQLDELKRESAPDKAELARMRADIDARFGPRPSFGRTPPKGGA